ncbi:hypothetical protein [uncultured Parasphingorhabdus sp.]|uniref:hypothetical protein n=1 Tax=uncultured Parasphingorhabdus sp. TaxID=2709694 RepID=UPI002AA6AC88|nr:hypothetical protein [uncultured Parasphingorhabdus sp.]
MTDAFDGDLLATGDLFEADIVCSPIDTDGICEQVHRAVIIHNQAVSVVLNFDQLYAASRQESQGDADAFPVEHDLLRAAFLFACSGLDAVVKQLIKDALPDVVDSDLGAHREFEKFTERRLKKIASIDSDNPRVQVLDARLFSKILTNQNPRGTLIEMLVRSLTDDSLQSRDQLLKVAAHFALTMQDVMANPDAVKDAFSARNQIVHEMDVLLAEGSTRRNRDYQTIKHWSESMLAIAAAFITGVDAKLQQERTEVAADEHPLEVEE